MRSPSPDDAHEEDHHREQEGGDVEPELAQHVADRPAKIVISQISIELDTRSRCTRPDDAHEEDHRSEVRVRS